MGGLIKSKFSLTLFVHISGSKNLTFKKKLQKFQQKSGRQSNMFWKKLKKKKKSDELHNGPLPPTMLLGRQSRWSLNEKLALSID